MKTKKLTPADRHSGRLLLPDALDSICRKCGARKSNHSSCESCHSEEPSISKCPSCSSDVEETIFAYEAKGERGSIVKEVNGFYCVVCNTSFLGDYETEQLEDIARYVHGEVRIIGEMGIASNEFFEIFANTDVERIQTRSSMSGVQIKFGPPSGLFQRALNVITDYDADDYGHSYSWTLRITPGLPYSKLQRTIVHTLLARIQARLTSSLIFWSVRFRPEDIEKEPAWVILSRQLQKWRVDGDKQALALCNDIASNAEPGAFINSFRLLELVLYRLLNEEIVSRRNDPNTSNEKFRDLVLTYGMDLKTRLQRRVEAIPSPPKTLLHELVRLIEPDKKYDPASNYDPIVKLRNRFSHMPNDTSTGASLVLPWEYPPWDIIVDKLILLIAAIIKQS